jgi:hypothetical protein
MKKTLDYRLLQDIGNEVVQLSSAVSSGLTCSKWAVPALSKGIHRLLVVVGLMGLYTSKSLP